MNKETDKKGNYIAQIFERTNIQSIRSFLLLGAEPVEIDSRSYQERIKTSEKAMYDILKEKISDSEERQNAEEVIVEYVGVLEGVYMEIGLQCGFILAMQMIQNTDPQNQ